MFLKLATVLMRNKLHNTSFGRKRLTRKTEQKGNTEVLPSGLHQAGDKKDLLRSVTALKYWCVHDYMCEHKN